MLFAKRLFMAAGIYGLVVLLPQYFLESRVGQDHPPAITHPEFYYGFIGVAAAWQVAFLIIARDPQRYREIIIPGVLEKVSFGAAAIVLFTMERVHGLILAAGLADLGWAALFVSAYLRLEAESPGAAGSTSGADSGNSPR